MGPGSQAYVQQAAADVGGLVAFLYLPFSVCDVEMCGSFAQSSYVSPFDNVNMCLFEMSSVLRM